MMKKLYLVVILLTLFLKKKFNGDILFIYTKSSISNDLPPLNYLDFENVTIKKIDLKHNKEEGKKLESIKRGLNIFGFCKNLECKYYGREVIFNNRLGIINEKFNLNDNIDNIKCPFCQKNFIPTTFGFLDCEYQIEGKKLEKGTYKNIKTEPKITTDNIFEYLNPDKNHHSFWSNVDIYIIEK